MITLRERPRWTVVVLLIIAAIASYLVSKSGRVVFDFWSVTSPDVIEEKEIEKIDEVEAEEIRKEETTAGEECESKRMRHPGMTHGMRFQFVHVPKTGGSSVQMNLDEWSRENPRVSLMIHDGFIVQGSSFKCPPRTMEHTLLIGHRGWGFCRDVEFSKQGLFTATALRSAVSRMVSLYDYNILTRETAKAKSIFGSPQTATRHTLSDLVKQFNATTDVIEPGEWLLRYSGWFVSCHW